MFTAILWDYDGTLANTPVKNLAVTKEVLRRLDPALLDPLPEALTSLDAYQAANYRWRNWRELYRHALHVPAERLDEAGALWGPCQLADRTLPPLFDGLDEALPRLAKAGAAFVVYTDIARDGMQSGVNLPALTRLAETSPIPVIAAGGMSTLADIKALYPLSLSAGLEGAISGRALYEGTLDLPEALAWVAAQKR